MKLPIAILGYVSGAVRLEKCGGGDWYPWHDKILFFNRGETNWNDDVYTVTHLQKRSLFGFLLMSHEKWWHLCFHFWLTFRYQERVGSSVTGGAAHWVPGTEKVLYWRVGYSRWDAGDCKYIGPPTWYGPGLHWD